ncbi:alpha-L-fucosidase [Paraglaciecola sp.]|uniref:alpha-L-fucosidase n=1 Tax=Paraglaciecola sp. TaxID=1920173 RepID=UPI003EF3421B
MFRKAITLFSIIMLTLLNIGCAGNNINRASSEPQSSKPQKVDALQEFHDAKFGMFIHWGLYSVKGGIYEGNRYFGISEWLMQRTKVSSAEYKKIGAEFNPALYDAKEWVRFAKEAGVKYIVITSKHHDGFALFDSKVSDFDVMDATPFKRDLLKELTDEAHKADIKIGFYYSQFQDWTEKDADGNTWEFNKEGRDFDKYLNEKAIPQIKELLTNYGDIDLIWFDTPKNMTIESSKTLKAIVKKYQPNCLVTSRIGHGLGDYQGYADGQIPPIPTEEKPWEAIFTHNESWGYSHFDHNFRSPREMLHLLVEVAGKGGNMLMNIGPDGSGLMPQASIDAFTKIGNWMKKNGESIYGTTRSPLPPVQWGHVTHKPGKLYLHVLNTPLNNELFVAGVKVNTLKASFLETGDKLTFSQNELDVVIKLPAKLPNADNSVIVLEYQGSFPEGQPERFQTVSHQYQETLLLPEQAELAGTAETKILPHFHYYGVAEHTNTIINQHSVNDTATWKIRVLDPGTYKVYVKYAADELQVNQEGVVTVLGTDKVYPFKTLNTGSYHKFKPLMFFNQAVALIKFDKPGMYNIQVRPDPSREIITELLGKTKSSEYGKKGLMKLKQLTIEAQY